MRHLAIEQLLSPAIQQAAADAMLARHFRRRQSRPQAFRDDLALLLERPNTASIAASDDLDLRDTSTLTTYLTSGLSVCAGSNRGTSMTAFAAELVTPSPSVQALKV